MKKILIACVFVMATTIGFVVHAEEAKAPDVATSNGQLGSCDGIWPFC